MVVRLLLNDGSEVLDRAEHTALIHSNNASQVAPSRERRFLNRLRVLNVRRTQEKLGVIQHPEVAASGRPQFWRHQCFQVSFDLVVCRP